MLAAVAGDEATLPVAGVDAAAGSSTTLQVPGKDASIPLARTLVELPKGIKPDVLLDFSTAAATLPAVRWAAERQIHFVVGTTGVSPAQVLEMGALADRYGVGGVVASNFALGAVLMMYLAEKTAPFFDYAEIIETHHETKKDAPSGTALTTARLMREARGKALKRNIPEQEPLPGARGAAVDGITIHSVRLPGRMAHQEVIFGTAGQTLSIRHDTINRDCYAPGVLLAIKHVVSHGGLVEGLDRLLGLKG